MIDVLQLIDADVLPQRGQQRLPRQFERLLDTEELRELFEQVRVDPGRQTHASLQWSQCNLQMRTGGVHKLIENMQAEDRAEFAADGLITAVQCFAGLGHDRRPQVTAALQREKQINGLLSDAEHHIEDMSFDVVQRLSVASRLADKQIELSGLFDQAVDVCGGIGYGLADAAVFRRFRG